MSPASPESPTPPVHEAAARRDWPAYFERIEGKPPRETLLEALDRFGEVDPADPPLALDIACGSGRDAAEMLARGWRVWAMDASEEGLARLRARPACAAALEDGRLELVRCDFADCRPPRADLVNASFALPFCPPAMFGELWSRLDGARSAGSRFAGQLFGDRDDWAILEDRTHLTRAQVLELLANDVLELFREEDRPSRHAGEAHKHWHVFHVVARKR